MTENNLKSDESKRIALSPQAMALLSTEVQNIRQKGVYYKINEARLATAIIERFCDRYLSRDRQSLERLFFDKRSYLKTLIEKADSEDALSSSISEYMKMSKRKRHAKAKAETVG